MGGTVEQGHASRRDMLLIHDWATIVNPHLFERRQTISHMSPSDFTYIVRRFPIYRQTISTYSWHQSAGGGKQFCLTAFETCYFWTIAKVPMKRVTFYWYLKAKTRNLLIYEGIWSWKHKNVCNFFNSCHTRLKLGLYKISFFGFFNFCDSFFL